MAQQRPDVRELRRALLQEGTAREEQLDVHGIEIKRAALEISRIDPDAARLDLHFQHGLCRRQRGLRLVALLLIRRSSRTAADLVELTQHLRETVAPAVHALVCVPLCKLARSLGVTLVEREVGFEVVALELLRHRLAVHAAEPVERLGHTVLQRHVVSHGQRVGGIQFRLVAEHLHEALILLAEAGVQNGALGADLVRTRVHQRRIFQMLVVEALDRIERQQRRGQPEAAPAGKVVMPQKLADRGGVVVQHAVRPEGVRVKVARLQQRSNFFEVSGVLHAPRDFVEADAVDVGRVEERNHVVLRAVLRDPRPRGGVDLAQLRDDMEGEGLCAADHLVVAGKGHRIVRIVAGRRKVEEVLLRLRAVGLQRHIHAARVKPVVDGHRTHGYLEQHLQLLPVAGGVGEHHLRTVDDVRQELVGHQLVETLAVLNALAVVRAEEVLRHQHAGRCRVARALADFTVKQQHRRASLKRVAEPGELLSVRGRLERQVQHGQRQHHLGEIRRGFREGLRQKGRLAIVRCIVRPEGVDRHAVGDLLLDRQVIIIVLSQFLRLIELLEEATRLCPVLILYGIEKRFLRFVGGRIPAQLTFQIRLLTQAALPQLAVRQLRFGREHHGPATLGPLHSVGRHQRHGRKGRRWRCRRICWP